MNFKLLGDLLIAICPALVRYPNRIVAILVFPAYRPELCTAVTVPASDPSLKNVPTIDPPEENGADNTAIIDSSV